MEFVISSNDQSYPQNTTKTCGFTYSYANELAECTAQIRPTPLYLPKLVTVNDELWQTLGLPNVWLENDNLVRQLFSPDTPLTKSSIAQKYGGHQFGQWNPMLGDGRGLLLAEVIATDGSKHDLHLKGAGPTPYSRHADGRAVLRSTIREYLASEAMHHLGIPTSRALCLFSTEEPVYREQQERAAMMIRTAPSHLRFGHFEYYHHNNEPEKLDALFAYAFKHHFPQAVNADNPHLAMLQDITSSTAKMIAKWQAYGFNHGVMNTDNMSVHGITFDYGPYAFLDDFEPHYICNRSDHQGRYRFSAQPSIGLWNLNALGQAFRKYADIPSITQVLESFEETLIAHYHELMLKRLGFTEKTTEALTCITDFTLLLQETKYDYHLAFRELCGHTSWAEMQELRDLHLDIEGFDKWFMSYRNAIEAQNISFVDLQMRLRAANPAVVLRNHHAQSVIAAAEDGDFAPFHAYLAALSAPFSEPVDSPYFAKAPEVGVKGIALSCSS